MCLWPKSDPPSEIASRPYSFSRLSARMQRHTRAPKQQAYYPNLQPQDDLKRDFHLTRLFSPPPPLLHDPLVPIHALSANLSNSPPRPSLFPNLSYHPQAISFILSRTFARLSSWPFPSTLSSPHPVPASPFPTFPNIPHTGPLFPPPRPLLSNPLPKPFLTPRPASLSASFPFFLITDLCFNSPPGPLVLSPPSPTFLTPCPGTLLHTVAFPNLFNPPGTFLTPPALSFILPPQLGPNVPPPALSITPPLPFPTFATPAPPVLVSTHPPLTFLTHPPSLSFQAFRRTFLTPPLPTSPVPILPPNLSAPSRPVSPSTGPADTFLLHPSVLRPIHPPSATFQRPVRRPRPSHPFQLLTGPPLALLLSTSPSPTLSNIPAPRPPSSLCPSQRFLTPSSFLCPLLDRGLTPSPRPLASTPLRPTFLSPSPPALLPGDLLTGPLVPLVRHTPSPPFRTPPRRPHPHQPFRQPFIPLGPHRPLLHRESPLAPNLSFNSHASPPLLAPPFTHLSNPLLLPPLSCQPPRPTFLTPCLRLPLLPPALPQPFLTPRPPAVLHPDPRPFPTFLTPAWGRPPPSFHLGWFPSPTLSRCPDPRCPLSLPTPLPQTFEHPRTYHPTHPPLSPTFANSPRALILHRPFPTFLTRPPPRPLLPPGPLRTFLTPPPHVLPSTPSPNLWLTPRRPAGALSFHFLLACPISSRLTVPPRPPDTSFLPSLLPSLLRPPPVLSNATSLVLSTTSHVAFPPPSPCVVRSRLRPPPPPPLFTPSLPQKPMARTSPSCILRPSLSSPPGTAPLFLNPMPTPLLIGCGAPRPPPPLPSHRCSPLPHGPHLSCPSHHLPFLIPLRPPVAMVSFSNPIFHSLIAAPFAPILARPLASLPAAPQLLSASAAPFLIGDRIAPNLPFHLAAMSPAFRPPSPLPPFLMTSHAQPSLSSSPHAPPPFPPSQSARYVSSFSPPPVPLPHTPRPPSLSCVIPPWPTPLPLPLPPRFLGLAHSPLFLIPHGGLHARPSLFSSCHHAFSLPLSSPPVVSPPLAPLSLPPPQAPFMPQLPLHHAPRPGTSPPQRSPSSFNP
ncbi:hypothetical protein C7M84_019605, partial [Penaeus vannamei]